MKIKPTLKIETEITQNRSSIIFIVPCVPLVGALWAHAVHGVRLQKSVL